jgi:hypothetical protein
MMQLKLRIWHKKECYCYYIYSLTSFLYLMYFSSLMMTYVTFSVQVLETYLQRTSCMKLYLLHFHTECMQKFSISVTKTTKKSVTYILLTTYLLQLSNNVTETTFKCFFSPCNTQHWGEHTISRTQHRTIWHYTVSAANSNHIQIKYMLQFT